MDCQIPPKIGASLGATPKTPFNNERIKIRRENYRQQNKTIRLHIQGERKREKLNKQGDSGKRTNNDRVCNTGNHGQTD